ncbi:metaxin-1b isoform X2 [Tachysurus fulvidraco]|uniref:metaxin-1b isoform X2 n=1 Tax=Tachysurus fulvidraco TaxID=1234273 RepID=UPI001FEDE5D3|nr:metaxin-1b isoform X2 [Tachysurus fulvidraco]
MAAPMELYCWKGDYGLPSVDVDCLIVLAYAKFAGAPLKVHKITNPWRSPTGTLPALRTKEESSLSQPSKIIIQLRKQIYTQWVDAKNYVDVTRHWYAENTAFPLNFLLPGRMHSRQMERLRLIRGDVVLEPEEQLEKELYQDALECMTLLSQRLGSHKFFFGDSPSSLDAYVFGHLAPLLKIKLPNCKLQQHLSSLENLTQFCSNILLLYFPSDSREAQSRKAAVHTEAGGGDFDNEPHKRRNQILSVLFGVAAMLGYAVLSGILTIQSSRSELDEPHRDHRDEEEEEEEEE